MPSLLRSVNLDLELSLRLAQKFTDSWGYCLDFLQKLILVLFFQNLQLYFCYLFELFCNSRDLAKLEKKCLESIESSRNTDMPS